MAPTSDDAAATPTATDDRPEASAGQTGTPAPGEASGGADASAGRETWYDEAAEEVADAMSATESEEFRATIGELRGDVVAGDKYIVLPGRRGAEVRARRIPGDTLTQPHVEASNLHLIDEAVRHHGIVAVRGPEGSGRTAALLQAFAGGSPAVSVLRLHPRTDLRTLAPEHIRDAQAVILEDLTEEHLDQLDDDYELDRLRDELANRWLGFTVSADLGLPNRLLPMVVDIGDPPSATEVFERHFQAAQHSSARRDAILGATEVRERVDAALRPPVKLGRAAELAVFLGTYEGLVEEVAARLETWLTRGADAERQRWFQALPDLRAHCTALALAVFHGLARETVMAQAELLIAHAMSPPDDEKPSTKPNVFASGVSLAALRATTTREKVAYAEGDVTSTVLRFMDPDYQPWVLQHAWDEFDAARPAVLAWLRELGGDPDPAVRVRAAGAAGVLAERAFQTINNQVVADWAAGPVRARRCAALALSAPTDPDLAATVQRMLEGWITDRSSAKRATAALHLGITAEPATVVDCLGRLAELADRDNSAVAVAVATSLADILGRHGGVMGGRVVHEITIWMNRRTWPGRRFAGHLAFLRLTSLVGDPTVPQREDPNRSVPSLLIGSRRSEVFARQISRAWHDGLTGRLHRSLGRSLTSWAELVEKRPEFEPVFVWMLREAASDARTGTVLLRAARSWTPDTAPRTAAAVLTSLTGGGAHG
jgi:hypothetical protein